MRPSSYDSPSLPAEPAAKGTDKSRWTLGASHIGFRRGSSAGHGQLPKHPLFPVAVGRAIRTPFFTQGRLFSTRAATQQPHLKGFSSSG